MEGDDQDQEVQQHSVYQSGVAPLSNVPEEGANDDNSAQQLESEDAVARRARRSRMSSYRSSSQQNLILSNATEGLELRKRKLDFDIALREEEKRKKEEDRAEERRRHEQELAETRRQFDMNYELRMRELDAKIAFQNQTILAANRDHDLKMEKMRMAILSLEEKMKSK